MELGLPSGPGGPAAALHLAWRGAAHHRPPRCSMPARTPGTWTLGALASPTAPAGHGRGVLKGMGNAEELGKVTLDRLASAVMDHPRGSPANKGTPPWLRVKPHGDGGCFGTSSARMSNRGHQHSP